MCVRVCVCVCDTEDVQLTQALLSLVGNLRGSPGPKGITVDGALSLLSFPAPGAGFSGRTGKLLFFPN